MAVALDLGSYTPISDYSSLLDNVRRWLDRGNELDQLLPSFVSLAEAYLNRTLRTPEMETVASPIVTDGRFALPFDFLAMRYVMAGGRQLPAMSPADLVRTYGGWDGCTRAYAINGRQARLAPASAEPVEIAYWQRIPPLSLNAPVNWLLANHADIYLYGTLASAVGYIDDPDRIAQWTGAFEGAVDQLAAAGRVARWGGPIVARHGVAAIRGVRA